MFEKAMTQLLSEGIPTGLVRKDNATQNLVSCYKNTDFEHVLHNSLVSKQSTVCSQNISNLCSLDAADTIVSFCLSLPHLASFIEKWNCAMEGLGIGLPSSVSEAQQLKLNIVHLKEELLLAKKALNLPLLEPLTKERLRQLTQLGMGCLLVANSVATSHSIFAVASPVPAKSTGSNNTNIPPSKPSASSNPAISVCNREEEWESNAITVVEAAVEIYQSLAGLIQRSPRSGRVYYDNFLYLAAWLLLSGLQGQMTSTSQVSSFIIISSLLVI